MKKQLLLLVAMFLMAANMYGQAVANPVADLTQCNYEIFDLTVQNAPVLGEQNPDNYLVTYFENHDDALYNSNPIADPTVYYSNLVNPTIYVRVTNLANGDFAITSFAMVLYTTFVDQLADVSVCTAYTLPPLSPGNEYRTGTSGGGSLIVPGTVITETQTIYIFTSIYCEQESSFTVTVGALSVPDIADVHACGSYILPALTSGDYFTGPNGTGTQLAAGTAVTISQSIFVFKQELNCVAEETFTVTISFITALAAENVAVCGSYTLPALELGGYYTYPGGPAGGGMLIPAGSVITSSQTLYLYLVNGACTIEGQFNILILTSDTIQLTPITGCGNDTGMAIFDLTQAIGQIQLTIPTAEVQFFTTAMDAATNTNPIVNDFAYNAVSSTIYAGITIPNNCYYTLALDLIITECTDPVLSGIVHYDADSDGCEGDDGGSSGVQVSLYINNNTYNTYTNSLGQYAFYNIQPGEGIVALSALSSNLYTITPQAHYVTISGDPVVADFCVAPTTPFTDVAVYIWPSTSVVPGFTAGYFIDLHNYGTTTESGQVTFTFDDTLYTFLSSPQGGTVSGNTVTFIYTDLLAGQQRFVYVEFTAAQPPVLNMGSEVAVSASITPLTNDVFQDNNTSNLTQIATNSYDPNDITVNKGEFITIDQANDYLQYTIRFQNMGTANATNVRISTTLNPNFDWDTFEPVGASHAYRATRVGNAIEFSFDGIQLPYESANEPGSHGSVSYRIKPKATIATGDVMTAQAAIFFDFNEAIITNIASTTVTATAGIGVIDNSQFVLYPNPATGIVNLQLSSDPEATVVTITNVLGKSVLVDSVRNKETTVNIASLKSGIYFVTLESNGKQITKKLIVK